MPSILEQPAFHYGVPLISAAAVAVIGVTVFSGLERLVVLVIVAVELLVVPQVLKRAA
jgi:hypothetical protein